MSAQLAAGQIKKCGTFQRQNAAADYEIILPDLKLLVQCLHKQVPITSSSSSSSSSSSALQNYKRFTFYIFNFLFI
jgi:hypothetical protein